MGSTVHPGGAWNWVLATHLSRSVPRAGSHNGRVVTEAAGTWSLEDLGAHGGWCRETHGELGLQGTRVQGAGRDGFVGLVKELGLLKSTYLGARAVA